MKWIEKALERNWFLLLILLLTSQACAEELPIPKGQAELLNYGIGVETARNLKNQGVEVNLDLLIQGLKDGLSGEKLKISERELRKVMIAFQSELRRKQSITKRFDSIDNKKKGEAFLAENKLKPGVVTLPSGLQYLVIKSGDGRKPGDTDTVECNYRGTFLDGTEFDASPPGQVASFRLSDVIPGWREALRLMPAGSVWKLFVPANLAYGERGTGGKIGPSETLIFEVELVTIK